MGVISMISTISNMIWGDQTEEKKGLPKLLSYSLNYEKSHLAVGTT